MMRVLSLSLALLSGDKALASKGGEKNVALEQRMKNVRVNDT
jgi:hypothetical protein